MAGSLIDLQTRGRQLMDQGRYDDALSSYRKIAAVDPGFPGVNLDLSLSLLKLKQTEASKQAINAQIATSECLSHLPADAFEAYCKAEMLNSPESCRQGLGVIQQSAYFQAALVQMELGHPGLPDAVTAGSTSLPISPGGPTALPSATAGGRTVRRPDMALARPDGLERPVMKGRTGKSLGPNALASGEGTDADLGAYSK